MSIGNPYETLRRVMAERVAKRICAVQDGDAPIPVDSVADAEPPIPDRKWIASLVAEEVETLLAEREAERPAPDPVAVPSAITELVEIILQENDLDTGCALVKSWLWEHSEDLGVAGYRRPAQVPDTWVGEAVPTQTTASGACAVYEYADVVADPSKWEALVPLVAAEQTIAALLAEREAERAGQVRQACKLLMEDDGFHEAMALLCPIAGLEFPAADVKVEARDLRTFFPKDAP